MRATGLATIALIPLVVLAAPVPKRVLTLESVFGAETDEKGKCTFEMDRHGALTVTKPAGDDPVSPARIAYRGPILAKSAEGDFTLTTRVTFTPPEKPESFDRGELPSVAAGLSVWSVEGEKFQRPGVMVVFSRTFGGGGWVSDFRHYQGKQAQWASKTVRPQQQTEGPVYLRVTRRGDATTQEWSGDGKKWAELGMSKLSGAVTFGPVVAQCTDQDFVVTFDEYHVKDESK